MQNKSDYDPSTEAQQVDAANPDNEQMIASTMEAGRAAAPQAVRRSIDSDGLPWASHDEMNETP